MAVVAFSALEQIAGRETELARALHAQFRRRLTIEDVRDAVADALVVAHQSRADLEGLASEQLEAWVRTRAYRNAIDQIRAIDGYGVEKRKSSVSVDDYAETLPDAGDGDPLEGIDDELPERYADGAAAHSVELALDRLTPDDVACCACATTTGSTSRRSPSCWTSTRRSTSGFTRARSRSCARSSSRHVPARTARRCAS